MARIIGPALDARDEHGRLRVAVATVFPEAATIVTEGMMHAEQHFHYLDIVNADRTAQGQPPLTEAERDAIIARSVDLLVDDRGILIRPNPARMDLAIAADELLAEYAPKRSIKYIWLSDDRVRNALKRRGENWRVYLPPTAADQIIQTIDASRAAIACGRIYYYSPASGSRLLTNSEFSRLSALTDSELQKQLEEIGVYSVKFNHIGSPEIEFFEARGRMAVTAADLDAIRQAPASARQKFEELRDRFRAAVPEAFRVDDEMDPEWRGRMFSHLMSHRSDALLDAETMGLDPELSMRIEWLPGGRIEKGELILDAALDEVSGHDPQARVLAMVRGLIFNILQEHGGRLEYLNVGSVLPSLSFKPERGGRREVYVAQIKQRSARGEILQIIRMQKWGIAQRLEQGKTMETAMLEAEEYTEYILDRLLACRQLGMNVPIRLTPRKVSEAFESPMSYYRGRIWTTYFLRDYIEGLATDKIPRRKFQDRAYSIAFASLMGQAAASNIILGRAELTGEAIFDVGDELLVVDEAGLPTEIAVTDHVGTFVDWRGTLASRAAEYAAPINRRIAEVPDPHAFTEAYLTGLRDRFIRIQEDYARNRRAFDTLFKHRPQDEGTLASRWKHILERLRTTDASALCHQIQQFFQAS
jgi:hypothetical protein